MNSSGVSAASRASKRATIVRARRQRRETLRACSRSVDRRGGAVSAREKFARMRIEGQHRRRQAQVFRGLDQAREHRLVAAMNAVEVADGQLRMARRGGSPRKTCTLDTPASPPALGQKTSLPESIEKLGFYRLRRIPVQTAS